MADNDEIVDVVDEDDVVVGQASRREVHDRGWLHRAVHVLAFDPQGNLLLQKRVDDDRKFNPGRWTSTVSGHVAAGDTYDATAQREVTEELQIAAPPSLKYIGKTLAHALDRKTGRACRTFTAVYTAHLALGAADIKPQVSEVQRIEEFPFAAVLASVRGETPLRCRNGEMVAFADNFAPIVNLAGREAKTSR
jgi:isopentenyldiphosphate isomerase